jgi:hypothetical protein
MLRLRDRNKFIPGGFRFLQPQIPRWSITPWASFDTAVQQIIEVRKANPLITNNNGLSLDPATVGNELEAYNVAICASMGWSQFLWEGGQNDPPPKASLLSQLSQSAQVAVAGAKLIAAWQIDGGTLVPQELAESRALTCSTCPKNGSSELTDWFTVPAAELIKKQLEKRNEMKIHTTRDPLLGTCSACGCVLRLKVHCPIEVINQEMKEPERQNLDERCWVLSESR